MEVDIVPMKPSGSVKLCLLGSGGVGKSSLVARLVSGNFIDKSMTVGFDVETWGLTLDDLPAIKVSLFDFGGQEHFRFFQAPLMVGAKIALLVFDCSLYRTLLAIGEWMSMVTAIPNELKLLVGNKVDRPDRVSEDEISRFAQELGLDYMLVSSKEGTNIDKLQERLMRMLRVVVSARVL